MSKPRVRVLKFGGAAMGSVARIRAAAERVAAAVALGQRIVVVVSAMAGETDRLLALGNTSVDGAADVVAGTGPPNRAELDVLAAAGEQSAAALFAINLGALGLRARSFLGHELPIRTDSAHGDAEIISVARERLDLAFARGEVPVVAGFQGVSPEGRITTLGRGGSDTTAVALAIALDAEECVFHKDVAGVYSADPHRVPGAQRFDSIPYEKMLALSRSGAKVLHSKCVALAMRHRIPLFVTDGGGSGTYVIAESVFETTELRRGFDLEPAFATL